MSDKKVVTEKITKANHLEDVFGIPSGTTEMTVTKEVTEAIPIAVYDEKDEEIERQMDTVKDMAQYTFETIQDQIQDVEPRFAARLHEVSASYLSLMLDAVKQKAKVKIEKDKLNAKRTSGPTKINQTSNNIIVSNTADIIESLRAGKLNSTEGEFTVLQDNTEDDD